MEDPKEVVEWLEVTYSSQLTQSSTKLMEGGPARPQRIKGMNRRAGVKGVGHPTSSQVAETQSDALRTVAEITNLDMDSAAGRGESSEEATITWIQIPAWSCFQRSLHRLRMNILVETY